jgi:preprotein translocase subunit Sec63
MKWKNRSSQLSDELTRLNGMDPHELLSIARDAGAEDVKGAYRRLVKVYHPDKADPFMRNHNEQVIRLVNAAYEKLMARFEGDS